MRAEYFRTDTMAPIHSLADEENLVTTIECVAADRAASNESTHEVYKKAKVDKHREKFARQGLISD